MLRGGDTIAVPLPATLWCLVGLEPDQRAPSRRSPETSGAPAGPHDRGTED